MFETIVWATDGSELADRAFRSASSSPAQHHSKIVAVHANELLKGRFGGAPLLADEPDLRREDRAPGRRARASSASPSS